MRRLQSPLASLCARIGHSENFTDQRCRPVTQPQTPGTPAVWLSLRWRSPTASGHNSVAGAGKLDGARALKVFTLKKTRAPAKVSTVLKVNTGARCANLAMRSWARTMS